MLKSQFTDYSFVVFPMAKAYEGFLKKFLYDMNLIDESELKNKHFRIGRALNPSLKSYLQDEKWVYDDVARTCGLQVAKQLWKVWTECRNHMFHYSYHWPNQQELGLTLEVAGEKLDQLSLAMQQAVSCKLKVKR